MNKLHNAYSILDLEPGSSLELIMHRYRQLAVVCHPDRVFDKNQKKFLEKKMKQINQARDILMAHFHSQEHTEWGCGCQYIEIPSRQPYRSTSNQKEDSRKLVTAANNSWLVAILVLAVIISCIDSWVKNLPRKNIATVPITSNNYIELPNPGFDDIGDEQPVQRFSTTVHPIANLPAIPGIDVPLPQQGVERSGLPLMPLGGVH